MEVLAAVQERPAGLVDHFVGAADGYRWFLMATIRKVCLTEKLTHSNQSKQNALLIYKILLYYSEMFNHQIVGTDTNKNRSLISLNGVSLLQDNIIVFYK